MSCRIITSNGRVSMIACGRTRAAQPCEFTEGKGGNLKRCNKPHTKLCDFKLEGPHKGKTCDRRVCDEHATNIGPDRDYCDIHGKYARWDRDASIETVDEPKIDVAALFRRPM